MTGIDDHIFAMQELTRKFEPGVMNRRVPEAKDIHALAAALRDTLVWIQAHDNPAQRLPAPGSPR
jgi:hypothetical protein